MVNKDLGYSLALVVVTTVATFFTGSPVVALTHSNSITEKDNVAEEDTVTPTVEEYGIAKAMIEPAIEEAEEKTVVVPVTKEKVVIVEKQVIDSPFPLKRLGSFTIKGYCNCDICKPIKSNPKAIREKEGVNVVADLSIIPEGTMLWIDGVGIRQVQPSGRVTKGKNIIVYFEKHEDVVKFGQIEKVIYKVMN